MQVTRVRRKKRGQKGEQGGKGGWRREREGGRQLGFMGHWRGMQANQNGFIKKKNNTLEGAIRELGWRGAPEWNSI